MKIWSTSINFKSEWSPKARLILTSTSRSLYQINNTPCPVDRKIINREIQWSSTLEFPNKFHNRVLTGHEISWVAEDLTTTKIYNTVYTSIALHRWQLQHHDGFVKLWLLLQLYFWQMLGNLMKEMNFSLHIFNPCGPGFFIFYNLDLLERFSLFNHALHFWWLPSRVTLQFMLM